MTFHSDQGTQYTSYSFRSLLRSKGVTLSYSRPGTPQDNAVVESFFSSIKEELIEVTLDNDTVKIDGNQAIAWSGSLNFTVEKTTASLIGSAASGEGLVNVYRGTGKVLIAPVRSNNAIVSAFIMPQ